MIVTSVRYSDKVEVLNKILEKAKITPDLKKAILEIKDALTNDDLYLAYEVSAVKSYIAGMSANPKNHFREDVDYNRTVLGGEDVYCLLDDMHHTFAFANHKLPSGMMVISLDGWKSKGLPKRESPTLKLITEEHTRIVKEASNS